MFQAGGFSAGSREGLYIVLCETVITLSLSHPWYATVQFPPSYIQIFLQTFVSKLTLFNNSSHQIIFSGTCMRRSIEYSVFLTHDPFIYAAFCRLLSSLKLTAHPKNVTFRKTQHTAWFSTRVSPPDLPPPPPPLPS